MKNKGLIPTKLIIVVFLLFLGIRIKAQENQGRSKPNVLLIYTDDHRYSGVHCLGAQQVETPNIDALAREGITFTNTYLMGSFSPATCIPSRAMLLSGRQLFKLHKQGHTIPQAHTTIGEAFQQAGYFTHTIGKWHQDNASLVRSFHSGEKIMGRGVYLVDQYRMPLWDWDPSGKFSKEHAYRFIYNEQKKPIRKAITKSDKRGPVGTEQTGPHVSEIFAQTAVEFLQNYKKSEPFFMYLAFPTPHDPRQAPEQYKALYPPEQIKLPPSYLPQHPFDNGHMVLRDEQLAPWPRTPDIVRQELADYYAIITHLDTQIGKVVEALKKQNQYENTIIVFAGDSGLALGNHGLLGKQNIYDEDGLHVPFIISGGWIKEKGRKINALSYIHDLFPTICDLANIPIPATVTGYSLRPIINKEQTQIRTYTYHAYKQFQRAIRQGDYKLIEYVRAKGYNKKQGDFEAGSRVTQLFNIKTDPWETTDLSFLPEYQEVLQSMKLALREKASELGDYKEAIDEQYDFWDFY